MHEVDTVFHLGAQTHRRTSRIERHSARWRPTCVARTTCSRSVAATPTSFNAWSSPPATRRTARRTSCRTRRSRRWLRGIRTRSRRPCADLIAHSYHHTYGLPVAIARCGNIYGGGDLNWSRIVPGTIRAFLREERPVLRSDGSFVRDYLYVRDAARRVHRACGRDRARRSRGQRLQLQRRVADDGDRARGRHPRANGQEWRRAGRARRRGRRDSRSGALGGAGSRTCWAGNRRTASSPGSTRRSRGTGRTLAREESL